MHKSIVVVLSLGLFFGWCFGQGSNLDFEEHSCNASSCVLPSGDITLTGWNIAQDVTLISKSIWQPAHENASVLLQTTNGPGSISQFITTKTGKDYKITFQLAGSQATATYTVELVVGSGNATHFNYSSQWLKGWQEKTYTFTATEESTLVRFTSLNAGANGPAVDNIEIAQMKEEKEEKEENLDVQIGIVVVAVVLVGAGTIQRLL